jgi:hypothetical protein
MVTGPENTYANSQYGMKLFGPNGAYHHSQRGRSIAQVSIRFRVVVFSKRLTHFKLVNELIDSCRVTSEAFGKRYHGDGRGMMNKRETLCRDSKSDG